MTEPDRAKKPPAIGSATVAKALGNPPHRLRHLHPPDSTAADLADLVVQAARHLDHIDQSFTEHALHAADHLHAAASGRKAINSLGVLQFSATQIDILAARRADAIDHLGDVIRIYETVVARGSSGQTRPQHTSPNKPTIQAAPTRRR